MIDEVTEAPKRDATSTPKPKKERQSTSSKHQFSGGSVRCVRLVSATQQPPSLPTCRALRLKALPTMLSHTGLVKNRYCFLKVQMIHQ